jgi:hypothetical protein
MMASVLVCGTHSCALVQGASKNNVNMSWDKIWAINKKYIDASAPRHTALNKRNLLRVSVEGAVAESKIVPLHPKNESVGTKTVRCRVPLYLF